MKFALAQINLTVGDIAGNSQKIFEAYRTAVAQGADVVLTPELSLSGYQLEDMPQQQGFVDAVMNAAKNLAKQIGDAALIIGLPWRKGDHLYNAAAFLADGQIQHVQFKHQLVVEGIYDETRIYKIGSLPQPILFRGRKLGLGICEDFWHETVPQHLAQQGAEIFLAINGSVLDGIDRHLIRQAVAMECSKFAHIPFVYCNLVGGKDEEIFDGGSFVLDAAGHLIGQAPRFQEFLAFVDWQREQKKITSNLLPQDLLQPVAADLFAACSLATRDYVRKSGFEKVILGLSGGVDSALVAAIAVDALGAENVHAYMLPSPYTSQDSLDDAAALAKNLRIKLDRIKIDAMMQTVESSIAPAQKLSGLSLENMQPRLRGLTLMSISNQTGALLLTTGNKSELAVGYATLYGDMCGAFNPIKDLYKTDVYKICDWINQKSKLIPERILTKDPTAELRPNQRDQDSLPPYDLLDPILYKLIEGGQSVQQIIDHGYDSAMVLQIAGMLDKAEYKRRQAAPGPKISTKAFGRDRRWPITNKWKRH